MKFRSYYFRVFVCSFLALAAAGFLVTGSASAGWLTPESGGSPNANAINDLYKVVLVLALIIFFAVEAVLFYSLFKFRASKGAKAEQIHGNTKLEIGWTVGAALILVVLSVVTFAELPKIRNPENSDQNGFQVASGALLANADKKLPPNKKALQIRVIGRQYVWQYVYANGNGQQGGTPLIAYGKLVVPTNTTVLLEVKAVDVIHSWWIPKLGGKFDAVPGQTNYTWFKISKPGVYRGQCAELCGRNHANMTAEVVAVSPDEYSRWIEAKRQDLQNANQAAVGQRRALEQNPQTPNP